MKLKEIGEFGLIDRISPQFLRNLPAQMVGIGDDCAVLPFNNEESILITTDMLIEDSHFLRDKIPPEDLGYKSLAVNLSDIAAMGGIPSDAFLSIGIPVEIEVEWLDLFFKGLGDLAEESGTHLLGGDTTKSPKHLIINIVVVGKMQTDKIKYRSKAKPGDDVFLTGFIGGSGAGLKLLLEEKEVDKSGKALINEHNRPRAHLAEGKWLAEQLSVNAMIDVSDGIDSDLCRIMNKSHCGIDVDLKSLPVSVDMISVCKQYGWNTYEIAATAGEDYCLLCTINNRNSKRIMKEYKLNFGVELYHIGQIAENSNELKYFADHKSVRLNEHGFDHFA
jgi:thiamine-monophosphate kinase